MNHIKTLSLVLLLVSISNRMDAQQRSLADVRNIALKTQSSDHSIKKQSGLNIKELKVVHSSDLFQSHGLSSLHEPFFVCYDESEDAEGFVIVSGDERMPEVLGYSHTGHFDISRIPSNLRYLMECYASQKENLSHTQYLPANALPTVEPLITSKWNQDDPYNQLCPLDDGERSATGCVATAISQIMNFYQYPICGSGMIDYVTETKRLSVSLDLADYPFAWNQMLDHYTRGNFTKPQANAVAQLMYAVGAASNMDYTNWESGTSSYAAMYALFNHFGYDSNLWMLEHNNVTDKQWYEIIVNELNQGRPLMLAGLTYDYAGHAFVVDGYQTKDDNLYFSINWGWGGYCDGYFICTDLNPEGQGIGGAEDAFNFGQTIILNCIPENGIDDAQSNFTAQSLTLSCNEFNSGESISFRFKCNNIFNRGVQDFKGKLKIVLVDEAEEGQTLGEWNLPELAPNYGFGTYSLNLNIDPLPNGNYTIKAYSVSDDSENDNEILSATGFPHFHVGRTGLDFTQDGLVNQEDLALLVELICNNGKGNPNATNADLNHDGRISVADLVEMVLKMRE